MRELVDPPDDYKRTVTVRLLQESRGVSNFAGHLDKITTAVRSVAGCGKLVLLSDYGTRTMGDWFR